MDEQETKDQLLSRLGFYITGCFDWGGEIKKKDLEYIYDQIDTFIFNKRSEDNDE
jgi:hypothetical protein